MLIVVAPRTSGGAAAAVALFLGVARGSRYNTAAVLCTKLCGRFHCAVGCCVSRVLLRRVIITIPRLSPVVEKKRQVVPSFSCVLRAR